MRGLAVLVLTVMLLSSASASLQCHAAVPRPRTRHLSMVGDERSPEVLKNGVQIDGATADAVKSAMNEHGHGMTGAEKLAAQAVVEHMLKQRPGDSLSERVERLEAQNEELMAKTRKQAEQLAFLQSLVMPRQMGLSCEEARDVGMNAVQARAAGYVLSELAEGGYSCEQAMEAGWTTLAELKEGGYTCKDVMEAGWTSLEDLQDAGFVEGLRAAGFSCEEAMDAGYTIHEMRLAGYSPHQCADAGFQFEEGKAAGYRHSAFHWTRGASSGQSKGAFARLYGDEFDTWY